MRPFTLRALQDAAQRGGSVTTAEASAASGYASDHIALIARKGIIKGNKRGRDWFIEARSLLDYMASTPRPGRKRKT
jgi:hypothetical protein